LLLPKNLLDRGTPWVLFKALGAGAVMAGFIVVVAGVRGGLPSPAWMAFAAASGIVYLGALLLFRTFTTGELAFARDLVRGIRFGRTPSLRETGA
jgi:hypothetical protein